jgi:predicted RNA binding protein YcfA (HicA-like mRNA interferase family)
VNSKDIIKRLNAEGWNKAGGKGSHQKFRKDGKIVIVPHPKKDLPVGTVKSIFKQAGWE